MTDQVTTEAAENIQEVSNQTSIDTTAQESSVQAESTDLLSGLSDAPGVDQGEQQAAPESEEVQDSEPDGAPESYEFDSAETFDPGVLGAFSEIAKELNMPQANAQKILDSVAPKIEAKLKNDVQATRDGWERDSRADPEIGGSGDEKILGENLAIANKAIDKFGDSDLRQLLSDTGIGNHPAVVRMFLRAGKAISEDKIVTGDSDVGAKPMQDKSFDELANQIYN